jgi:hypothetical protein
LLCILAGVAMESRFITPQDHVHCGDAPCMLALALHANSVRAAVSVLLIQGLPLSSMHGMQQIHPRVTLTL